MTFRFICFLAHLLVTLLTNLNYIYLKEYESTRCAVGVLPQLACPANQRIFAVESSSFVTPTSAFLVSIDLNVSRVQVN